jgi:ATP-dependent Clp protease protease subunit
MKKFWNFIRNDAGERILRLEGPIDEDSFWGDEVTPRAFREDLEAEEGDVTVWINSPGGNVFAAAEIYTMLCDHKGRITVKIDAIAASAASVIAMAGDRVLMSPVAMLMIHDPMTIAMGNAKDMEKAISTLNEVKASIINAYQKKTGLSRNKISQLMENETWMNAKKAVELGFADEILFADGKPETKETEGGEGNGKETEAVWQPYSTRVMGQTILNRLGCTAEAPALADEEPVEAKGEAQDVEPSEAGLTDMFEEAIGEAEPEAEGTDTIPQADTISEADTPPAEDDAGEPVAETVEDTLPKVPLIGMDGKTPDGAMPYELLRKQLDFLR